MKSFEITRKGVFMKPMVILIAGPYMSGTDGDPSKIAANQARLESFALPLFERGHLPIVSEWMTLPIVKSAGSQHHGDDIFNAYQYPVAQRLLRRCDAVLRISGASKGADLDVETAKKLGLTVFDAIESVPDLTA
jgi:hypothetical protein